jgi:hypothetical protein
MIFLLELFKGWVIRLLEQEPGRLMISKCGDCATQHLKS